MNKKSQVRPNVVDSIQFVALNDFFHAHLYPCRYTYYQRNIPFRGLLHYFFEFLVPISFPGYFSSWLVKRSEPEWKFLGGNSAKVAGIISWPFLEVGTSSQHKPAFA